MSDVAFVVTAGTDIGESLAQGLVEAGLRVALLSDTINAAAGAQGSTGPGMRVAPRSDTADAAAVAQGLAGASVHPNRAEILRWPVSFSSRADVAGAFAAVVEQVGVPRLIVHSAVPATLLDPKSIDALAIDQWATTHSAAKSTLYCLQVAHDHLKNAGGGTIVCVGPALSLVGAAKLVALSTVLEAQRALMKSAARQWGRHGIRVHWTALGASESYPLLQSAALPNGPELGPPPPALGRIPTVSQDVAAIAAFLGGPAGRALTGATLVADGGVWMVP